jgi:hypothetical protein
VLSCSCTHAVYGILCVRIVGVWVLFSALYPSLFTGDQKHTPHCPCPSFSPSLLYTSPNTFYVCPISYPPPLPPPLPAPPPSPLAVASSCLGSSSCRNFETWGFTDRHTWIGTDSHPLPFNTSLGWKPAATRISTTLATWPRPAAERMERKSALVVAYEGPYSNPYAGPCFKRELNLSVTDVPGLFCSPHCEPIYPNSCPPTKPAAVTAMPECIIGVNSTVENYCALICNTDAPNQCDKAGGAICHPVQGNQGVCTYPAPAGTAVAAEATGVVVAANTTVPTQG